MALVDSNLPFGFCFPPPFLPPFPYFVVRLPFAFWFARFGLCLALHCVCTPQTLQLICKKAQRTFRKSFSEFQDIRRTLWYAATLLTDRPVAGARLSGRFESDTFWYLFMLHQRKFRIPCIFEVEMINWQVKKLNYRILSTVILHLQDTISRDTGKKFYLRLNTWRFPKLSVSIEYYRLHISYILSRKVDPSGKD